MSIKIVNNFLMGIRLGVGCSIFEIPFIDHFLKIGFTLVDDRSVFCEEYCGKFQSSPMESAR